MKLFLGKKGRTLWCVLAFFCGTPLSYGDTPFYSADPDAGLSHLPSKMWSDLSNIFIPENGVILTLGGSFTAMDWAVMDNRNPWPQELKPLGVQGLWDFGNFYGEGWVEGLGGMGTWAVGGFTSDIRLAQFGRDATESLIMATLLVTGVKVAVNRTRPDGGSDSFPSGHTITAFCVAPVITAYGGVELGIPAYAFATVTALARVEGHHHYLSDVAAGATLGIILGNAVVYKPKDLSVHRRARRPESHLVF